MTTVTFVNSASTHNVYYSATDTVNEATFRADVTAMGFVKTLNDGRGYNIDTSKQFLVIAKKRDTGTPTAGVVAFRITDLISQYAQSSPDNGGYNSNLIIRVTDSFSFRNASFSTVNGAIRMNETSVTNTLLVAFPQFTDTYFNVSLYLDILYDMSPPKLTPTFAYTGTDGVVNKVDPPTIHESSGYMGLFITMLILVLVFIVVIAILVGGFRYYKKRKSGY